MGALAITVVVGAALLIGFGVQYLTRPRTQQDWLFVAIATGIGGYVGSEVLTSSTGVMAGGPEIDGLVVLPAVITGLVLGLLADAFVRYIALDPV
ncbi:MAG: hypothetical protein ACYC9W_03590 [Candidatus Limnocylindria bacterium]